MKTPTWFATRIRARSKKAPTCVDKTLTRLWGIAPGTLQGVPNICRSINFLRYLVHNP